MKRSRKTRGGGRGTVVVCILFEWSTTLFPLLFPTHFASPTLFVWLYFFCFARGPPQHDVLFVVDFTTIVP